MSRRDPETVVTTILASVRSGGDEAVKRFAKKFDGAEPHSLSVPRTQWEAALARLEPEKREALVRAARSIRNFQEAELAADVVHEADGIRTETKWKAVERAGCYVPGGRAIYPSTVLMTVIPAKVAGVKSVALCVPPGPTGAVADVVLAAAAIADADALYPVGGAQAVAALAYGTPSIPAVDVIVGPGNVYVAIAKRQVAAEGRVAVPAAFAGPSEVVVIADSTVDPKYAAIDVVVQAEHGPGGLAWLVTWDSNTTAAIEAEIEIQVARAQRRVDIESTLSTGGLSVVVDSPEAAMVVSNAIAPEHLELLCGGAEELIPLVHHAGAVFCGSLSPASIGDYIAGPSHVLPTFGSARFAGALVPDDFRKPVHIITVHENGLLRVAPDVSALALAEGLPAHAESVRIRTSDLTT